MPSTICRSQLTCIFLILISTYIAQCRPHQSDSAPWRNRKLQQEPQPPAAAAVTGPSRPSLTSNSTCAPGDDYIDCYVNPCDYYPCPIGYLGVPSGCGGTCRCKCRQDPTATSLTDTSGVTYTVPAVNRSKAVADPANALQQQRQQRQRQPQCTALLASCTCSSQCCGGLSCGFAAVTSSPESSNATQVGSSSNATTNVPQVAAAAGPACRNLEDIDMSIGVVNYGC